MDHSHDTDFVVHQHLQNHQVGKCQKVGRPPNCSQTHQVERCAFVVGNRAKEGVTQLQDRLRASVIGKKARQMSACYIMWEYECTHVFGNATLSNIIRKNFRSRKCVYRVHSVRYVENMFLYCPNHINKQKVRKSTLHAL